MDAYPIEGPLGGELLVIFWRLFRILSQSLWGLFIFIKGLGILLVIPPNLFPIPPTGINTSILYFFIFLI